MAWSSATIYLLAAKVPLQNAKCSAWQQLSFCKLGFGLTRRLRSTALELSAGPSQCGSAILDSDSSAALSCVQHHDPHALNYAQAAREEVHEAATSPRAVALRGKSGVEAWDKVRVGLKTSMSFLLPFPCTAPALRCRSFLAVWLMLASVHVTAC
jgi:hypothetical protein